MVSTWSSGSGASCTWRNPRHVIGSRLVVRLAGDDEVILDKPIEPAAVRDGALGVIVPSVA